MTEQRTPRTQQKIDAEARFAEEIFQEINNPDFATDRKIDEAIERGLRKSRPVPVAVTASKNRRRR